MDIICHRPHQVLPPYLLDHLIRHGHARLRAFASDTLALNRQLLVQRIGTGVTSSLSAESPSSVPGQVLRRVYSADQGNFLPGRLVREEGQPESGDAAVDEAFNYLGATYALFWEVYRRHSTDNAGMPLVGTVHYGQGYENAFWNGEQMVFGDGDGEVFQRFTIAVDIVAHELTHGVIDQEAALIYQGQAGALNESLCDVFGSLVKQYYHGQRAEEADWLIGAELFGPAVQARGLRSMQQPGSAYDDPLLGKDPQPGHMDGFVATRYDNGGVHINSGIPNRAFYLAATQLGGYAWERAGRIWYETLCDERLDAQADFIAFAGLSATMAGELFGVNSEEQHAVAAAWAAVGVE
jgi:Zn-dependent metalloprotease